MLFALAGITNILYYLFLYSRLALIRQNLIEKPHFSSKHPRINVVICAKNEANVLPETLTLFNNLKYANYKIIFVDDHSSDNTLQIAQKIAQDNKFIEVLQAPPEIKNMPGKKAVLDFAIQQSDSEWILLTDADCRINSADWISSMLSAIEENEIVLGYGPMEHEAGFWKKFFAFETALTAIQYFSYALAKIPYMGVGRNLLYKKSLYKKTNGFSSHKDLASGDDDLFIQEAAEKNKVTICLDSKSFMYSKSPKNLFSFLKQKTRHVSTSYRYKRIHKMLLFGFAASQITFYFMLCALLFTGIWHWALTAFGISLIIKWPIIAMSLHRLKETLLIPFFPLFDFLLAIYYFVLGIISLFASNKSW